MRKKMIQPGGVLTEHQPHTQETRDKIGQAVKRNSLERKWGITISVTVDPPDEQVRRAILTFVEDAMASAVKLVGAVAKGSKTHQ